MKALIFLGGLIVGALLGAGVIVYLEARASLNAKDDIIFAKKTFYAGETFAAISGTLTGDELAYPNNTHSFGCFREQAECFVNYVEQIGVKQIGRLTAPTAYPIIKWDAFEIVARDEPVVGCFRTTITIGRKTESLLWVEEPINQVTPNCRNADTKIRKYTVEDSPGWKRIFGGKRE